MTTPAPLPHAPGPARSFREPASLSKAVLFAGACLHGLLAAGCAKSSYDLQAIAATALEKDVRAANDELEQLADLVDSVEKAIQRKELPESLSTSLAGLEIHFGDRHLDHAGVMDFPGSVRRPLLRYTMAVEHIQHEKTGLQAVLTTLRAPIQNAWKERSEQQVTFSVVLRPDPRGMVAELASNTDPFDLTDPWPRGYSVTPMRAGRRLPLKVERWHEGPLPGAASVAVPVDPATTNFIAERQVLLLRSKLAHMRDVLRGDDSLCWGSSLLGDGDELAKRLHEIAEGP